jgi:nucleoside-diphosphate-sugar epimerase
MAGRPRSVDGPVETVDVGVNGDGLGIDSAAIAQVGEVYNVTGAYRFGMSCAEAHAANVHSARRVASKVQSDAVAQATARQLGVPSTVVNPSTVIGRSRASPTRFRAWRPRSSISSRAGCARSREGRRPSHRW